MTTSATRIAGGRQATWTREKIIERIRRWVDLYGEPPRAADWNPSAAKWSAAEWRIERYKLGDPETGEAWPSLNGAKKLFGGSLSAAVVAAGFEPNKPGPKRREDVRPDVADRLPVPPDVRVALEGATAEARDLRARVEVRDRQLAVARAGRERLLRERDAARRAAARAAKPRVKTKTRTRTVVREDARASRRAERAVAEAAAAKVAAGEARMDAAEARRDATRLAARLERSEATVSALRDERRDLKRERDREADRTEAARAALARARAERAPAPAPEVREVVRVERRVVELPPPEAVEVDAARKLAAEADRKMADADMRVAKAEREYRELAEAATGEARKLTDGELAELRKGGPSGPAVLARALKSLARARSLGGRDPMRRALTEVASAAVRWRDRL